MKWNKKKKASLCEIGVDLNLKSTGKVLRFKKQILNGNFIFREKGSKILGSLLNQQIKRYWPELITVNVVSFELVAYPKNVQTNRANPEEIVW